MSICTTAPGGASAAAPGLLQGAGCGDLGLEGALLALRDPELGEQEPEVAEHPARVDTRLSAGA